MQQSNQRSRVRAFVFWQNMKVLIWAEALAFKCQEGRVLRDEGQYTLWSVRGRRLRLEIYSTQDTDSRGQPRTLQAIASSTVDRKNNATKSPFPTLTLSKRSNIEQYLLKIMESFYVKERP